MKLFNLLSGLALIFSCAFFTLSCDEDDSTESLAASDLLTNGSSKIWYLATNTQDANTFSCQAASPQSSDNKYVFYADGTFEFDNGEIESDPDCTDDNCCSDQVSCKGTWKFTDNGEGIEVFAIHEKGDPSHVLNNIIFEIGIDVLETGRLILSDTEASFMFRPVQQQADEPCLPNTRCPSI